jgi:hypothetical protein
MNHLRLSPILLPIGTTLTLTVFTLIAIPQTAQAQMTTYSSLSTFQSAAPVTTLEDFMEGANINTTLATGPLDKDTNNSNFALNAIKDGLRLSFPGASADQYFYNNHYAISHGITSARQSGSLDIILYNNNSNAVGFDFTSYAAGNLFSMPTTITTYDTTGALINSLVIDPGSGAFFGVTSSTNFIGRVNIDSPIYETVTNIRFSSVAAPEPSALALLIFCNIGWIVKKCGNTTARRIMNLRNQRLASSLVNYESDTPRGKRNLQNIG